MHSIKPGLFTFHCGNDSIEFIDAAYALFCSHRFVPWSKDMFAKSLQNELSVVICEQDCVVGYIIVSHVLDQAEIEDICVLPDYRQRGIANQLLQHVFQSTQSEHGIESNKDKSTTINTIFLEVAKTNENAIGLYEKHAFEVCGLRKNYYETASGKVDAILMKWANEN
jgi:ribosomal-protein-alanine N-acetyltransferase